MEPHADAVVNGGSAISAPAAATPEQNGRPTPPRARRVAAPSGVPTAADLAAAHAAVEWDQYEERDLLGAADSLRTEVASLTLPLQLPDVEYARAEREELLGQLDDYLLPRLTRLDAPLLAVVGGSTGAGKSTLVNSIARREVTRSGVLRPTTRSPVLVHHPYDSGAFLSQRVLPGLTRVTSEAPEPAQPIDVDAPPVTALRLVPHDGITAGLAIIDAPDIDSVVEANRDLAVQLLAAADLWVFVTTATRYSDNVPWQMLRQAVERGVAVAVVLDRVPLEVMQEVRTHLATLLRDRGLGTSPMFTIPETTLEDGYLPVGLVAPLAGWLRRLALDARSRDVVVRRTLIGVLDSLHERVRVVAAAADAQAAAEADLRADVDSCYDAAHDELRRSLLGGGVVRGEVLGALERVRLERRRVPQPRAGQHELARAAARPASGPPGRAGAAAARRAAAGPGGRRPVAAAREVRGRDRAVGRAHRRPRPARGGARARDVPTGFADRSPARCGSGEHAGRPRAGAAPGGPREPAPWGRRGGGRPGVWR